MWRSISFGLPGLWTSFFLLLAASGAACGAGTVDGGATDGGLDGGLSDAGASDAGSTDGGADAGTPGRQPHPADRVRYGVVSHARDTAGVESSLYQVFTVGLDGAVAATGQTFELGRSVEGEIVFTPDGEIGMVPQIDGSIGVFRLDPDGTPTVIDADLTGPYASQVVMHPRGERAYVVDFNWENNGGGIYELSIGEDDTVTVTGRVLEGRNLGRMLLLEDGEEALVAGRGVGPGVGLQFGLFHLDLRTSPPTLLSHADVFGDTALTASSLALTPDGRFVLVGDNDMFDGHRIGVARLDESTGELVALPVLPQQPNPPDLPVIEDPTGIYPSPFGDRVLVVSGAGSQVLSLTYDPTTLDGSFALEEIVPGVDRGPSLPFASTMIRRGTLEGLVLIGELHHVRRYQLERDGSITDLGRTALDPVPPSLGAIGVQP